MSALRIAGPGQPARLIPVDDGVPAKVRRRWWLSSLGAAIVAQPTPSSGQPGRPRGSTRPGGVSRGPGRPVTDPCGAVFAGGSTCARTRGHRPDGPSRPGHKGRAALDRENARRMSIRRPGIVR